MSEVADVEHRSVAITGAGGFVGSALSRSLRADGIRVLPLVRRPARSAEEISWDPASGAIEAGKLEGVDAVIHLAGENIAGIWTPAKKRRIRDSRVQGTELVARTLAQLGRPPEVLVSVSGVNYYGDRGDDILTESDPPGDDFLARVCVAWEQATSPAAEAGIRVVRCRMGLVLDPSGGALRLMLPAFRLGLGATLGSGRQWFSWVSLTDAVRAFRFCLADRGLDGAANVASPEPVRNRDFTETVAAAVHRPALLKAPAFALRAATGGMADALLLSSVRAVPHLLQARGFRFDHAQLPAALAVGMDGNG